MKILKVKLENFRSYREETEINLSDLSVFVGKNDIGKSTILEALDVFFNEGGGTIKLDIRFTTQKMKTTIDLLTNSCSHP